MLTVKSQKLFFSEGRKKCPTNTIGKKQMRNSNDKKTIFAIYPRHFYIFEFIVNMAIKCTFLLFEKSKINILYYKAFSVLNQQNQWISAKNSLNPN